MPTKHRWWCAAPVKRRRWVQVPWSALMVPKLTRSSNRLKPGGRRFDSVRDHSWTFGAAVAQRQDTPEAAGSIPAMSTQPDLAHLVEGTALIRRSSEVRFLGSGLPSRRLVDARPLVTSSNRVRFPGRVPSSSDVTDKRAGLLPRSCGFESHGEYQARFA
jgi:hypothetical protein